MFLDMKSQPGIRGMEAYGSNSIDNWSIFKENMGNTILNIADLVLDTNR